ncbi:MAG: hypothetical protein JW947_08265 [Sedimentisphaerales bacterium]|nr:hypothetical protein [Sedimentisphaerales bacterium]
MVALNFNSLCKEAEPYYYDFLSKEGQELVPESVIGHIKQCRHCQEQIGQLTRVLTAAGGSIESESGQASSATTVMLKLHLAYVGKPVSCETIKPFLPSLLDPALRVGIPTPITVHIDNCQKCSEDLDAIQKLNLSRKQTRRLSQLFADGHTEDDISCAEAQNAIPSVVSMIFGETDSEVLRHLCVCPDCREQLYQRREMVLRGLQKTSLVENKFPCERVSARDFFDYTVPYGFDAASDQYARFRESLTSHLRTCPTCLEKMQELHRTIYGICERPGSEVVTVYRLDESARAEAVGQADVPYAGFPVRVEVNGHKEAEAEVLSPEPVVDFAASSRRKTPLKILKPLFKAAVAAAAVLAIAAILLLNAPTARAVTLESIYEAIEKISNVHITSFVPDKRDPIQEQWVSRTARTYLLKTERGTVLWDISNRVSKNKQTNSAITETVPLTAVLAADAEAKITGSLGLLPFYDMKDVPKDAEWSRAEDGDLEANTKGIEVYDLTWTKEAYDSSMVLKKWRVFTDPRTNLPQRIEWYERSAGDSDYILNSAAKVEYLSERGIQEVIKEASF